MPKGKEWGGEEELGRGKNRWNGEEGEVKRKKWKEMGKQCEVKRGKKAGDLG